MSDSDAVDAAVMAKLAEPTLAGLMPGGVFYDIAPAGLTQFVIVSLLAHDDEYMFGGVAFERFLYLVKAVEKITTTTGNAKTAGARIHTLMQCFTAAQKLASALVIPGYTHEHTKRVERVRIVEVDDIDPEIRWQHRGGHYEVLVSPN